MEKDNETDITAEDILNALGTENREEKLYKLLEFLTKDRLIELKKMFRNLFKAKLKMIDKDMFGDLSNRQIQKLLDEYYDKLCLFTHSTLVVNEMVEGTLNNDEDLFLMIAKQNMYFLEVLLNCCLKYITNDDCNSIGYEYMFVGWYILISDINREKYTKEYLSRYSGLLYEDINKDYIKQSNNDLKQLQEEMKKLDKIIKENPFAVIEFLESFLNKEDK